MGLEFNRDMLLQTLSLEKITTKALDSTIWQEQAWRVLQSIVPPLAALIWIAVKEKKDAMVKNYYSQIIFIVSTYVILKSGFNFLRVGMWHQGHWYYPLCIMCFNLLIADLLHRAISWQPHGWRNMASTVAASAWIIIISWTLVAEQSSDDYNMAFYHLWKDRYTIQSAIAPIIQDKSIIEFDDGITNYTLEKPTMSGLGLTLDKEAFIEFKKHNNVFELAHKRGFSFFSSLIYIDIPPEADSDTSALRRALQSKFNMGEEFNKWQFSVAYRHPKTNWVLVGFVPG